MLRWAAGQLGMRGVEGRFAGQRHPGPRLLCEQLGLCDPPAPGLEAWFRRYEHRWVGAHAWTERWDAVGAELRAALDADAFHAAADAVVCAGPFWVCALLA